MRSKKTVIHLLPDIVAVIATTVVFVVASVTNISDESLIQTTCGALALFSTSLLIIRLTTLEKMDNALTRVADTLRDGGPLREAVTEQSTRIRTLTQFLTDGAFDEKLLNAAATANGYRQSFERVGMVDAYPTLGEVDLAGEMRQAKDSIRIIASWTGCLISLGDVLLEKARSGCDIRILILRHNSEFARLRGLELDPEDELGVRRQIATEMCEFNRMFRQHPELKGGLRVKAFDARPTMCMFARDESRLVGSLWPGINAMDGPVVRLVGDGDPLVSTTLGTIADREFERLWYDRKTLYVNVVDGEPQYTELSEMAWFIEGQTFASVLAEVEQAVRVGGKDGRKRALRAIKSDPAKVHVAVLELHEKLRSNHDAEASMIVQLLEEIGELDEAEIVLREAVNCGYVQYLEKLVQLLLRAGKPDDAEKVLRRAVPTGNYFAIFRLVRILEKSGRRGEIERVLRTGADAGSSEALKNLVDLLDRANRTGEADRLLQRKVADGVRAAGDLLAIRDYTAAGAANGARRGS